MELNSQELNNEYEEDAYEFASRCLDIQSDQGQAQDMQNPFNVNDMKQTDGPSSAKVELTTNRPEKYEASILATFSTLIVMLSLHFKFKVSH